jgi:spore coat protein U-like protein
MSFYLKMLLGLAAVFLAAATPVAAGQKTDTLRIGIKISTTCRIAAPDLDFGTATQVLGTEVATGNVSVWCNLGVPFSLSFTPTGRVPNLNSTLIGETPGNPGAIPFQLRRTGSAGIGLGQSLPLLFPMRATLTATPDLWVDTYKRTVTIYLTY